MPLEWKGMVDSMPHLSMEEEWDEEEEWEEEFESEWEEEF
ncbi:hypothetical protein GCM10007981_16110 [Thermocladium modestius]|uniref:Uncharacterized protein n=1 Tax=Thermocladium modestius TaxID=62609 RepID=A0A830GVD9_9CREN|nr:hypothetical protein GCM10007981_16110 [Thermocladium modestius]